MAKKLATEDRFVEYVARLGEVIGHADRREPLRAYMAGLLLPGERKSVEPMAAKIDPRNVESRHQSMHHFVADGHCLGRGDRFLTKALDRSGIP